MKLIDMHAHLFAQNGYEREKSIILKNVEIYGIDRVCVSVLNGFFPTEDEVEVMNREACNFTREHAECISAYVYVSPEHENALSVLRRGIEDYSMIGAKVWVSERCDSPKMNPLAEALIGYGAPLLIHSFKKSTGQVACESTAKNVRELALRYPELKIIMAHVDGNCYEGVECIRGLENVYVDVSGSTARRGEVEYAVGHLGEDRVLFGSDITGCSFAVPYGKVLDANVTDEVKEKILYKNAMKLFGDFERRGL